MRIGAVCLAVATVVVGWRGIVAMSAPAVDHERVALDGFAPARSAATLAPSAPAPAESLDELRERIAMIMEREHIPGAGIALIERDSVVWVGGIGLADRERAIPVTADTLFRVGSITKPFLVMAVMQLVEQGRLDLDGSVAQLVPELGIQNRWAAGHPITVAQLLEHTSGFDEMRPNETFAPPEAESMSLSEVLARNPASRRARWVPGSRASYSNPGYTVAAYLLEKLTGEPYEDVIERALFRPLGMTGASLRMTPDVAARLARGYDEDDQPVVNRGIYHRPAGNLMVSARDLAPLVQLAIARGRVGGTALLSPASMDRIERSETTRLDQGDARYGLGNWGDVAAPVVLRGHGGYAPGYLSMYGYSSSRGFGYVLLVNSSHEHEGRWEIRRQIIAYLLRGQTVPPPPRAEVAEAELQRWVGSYHNAAPHVQLMAFHDRLSPGVEVFLDHGQLAARVLPGDEPPVALIPVGGDRFRMSWASGSHLAFGHDSAGRRICVTPGDYFVEEPRMRTLAFAHGPEVCITLLSTGLLLPLLEVFRRRRSPPGIGWPLAVSLSLFLAPQLFAAAVDNGTIGERNVYTVGLFLLSLVFPLATFATTVQTLAWLPRPGSLLIKLHRLVFALTACCVTAYLGAYGILGVRIWAY